MALAYSDVRRAFERFLQLEPTRPFILAGHSQGGGTCYVRLLLQTPACAFVEHLFLFASIISPSHLRRAHRAFTAGNDRAKRELA